MLEGRKAVHLRMRRLENWEPCILGLWSPARLEAPISPSLLLPAFPTGLSQPFFLEVGPGIALLREQEMRAAKGAGGDLDTFKMLKESPSQ